MTASTLSGSCQCGAVRFTAKGIDLDATLACNCSRCGRLGTILSFVPATDFTLKSGEDAQTEYLFNKHAIRHQFCKTCGVQSFAYGAKPDGTKMVAVNVRCLEGVNVHDLKPKQVDGRSF